MMLNRVARDEPMCLIFGSLADVGVSPNVQGYPMRWQGDTFVLSYVALSMFIEKRVCRIILAPWF